MRLSGRSGRLAPSATLNLDARAKAMIRAGEDVISLATGEPDFDTPEHIKRAAQQALEGGFTKYTPSPGIPELREAIARKLERENGLAYRPDQIVATTGAKQALHNALLVLCEEGDEVIIPSPYWVSYVEQVKLADATPVIVDCGADAGFKLTPDALRQAIGDRTRAFMLNSPSNPTGAVYTESELAGLAEVIRKAGIFVITDEVYEHLVFDGNVHVSIARVDPDLADSAIVINGLSKAYAMTGWRLGYAAGPGPVIKAMIDLQGHTTSHVTSFVQRAAIAALDGPVEPIREMVREFDRRRKILVQRLNAVPRVSCDLPAGAFYAFPDVTGWIGQTVGGHRISSSEDLAEVLLTQARIAVVPGEAFGAPGYLRFSYALDTDRLIEAMDRMSGLMT